ncbi:DUF397 domain-containing protein [Streptomyces sp. WM6373]|uniref:DUF397 domain-containing protein n=1 Tax=Streptomyces sp. WM6373 TaxID=1415556 RepID=UPI00099D2DAF|nr:DUF397 domain-containing protein [Streptomyces sp. WM6373]
MKVRGGERVSGLVWVKSSYSSEEGGECVEVAMDWRKSSRRSGAVRDCLEAATCSRAIHVRDSKDTTRPALMVGASAWIAFVGFATR